MAIAEDRRRLASRLSVLQVSVSVAFALLAGSFWFLQIVQHAKFQEMAENNHQRTLGLRAPRGVIFDRTGRVLVENRNSFNISIVREHTKDLSRTIRVLAEVTGLDEQHVRETVDRHRREPTYRPIVIVQDASLAQVAAVTARRLDFELPDVVVQEVPTRQYPDQAMAAHLIGYVGEATEDQTAADSVATGAIVGQSGVERTYNKVLMGADGARRVVVNSVGREIRTIEEVAPVEGTRVQLAIDYAMQKAAEDAFRVSGHWGSAIVLDPNTGDVLTLASLPAYDPNAFATGIDRSAWAALNTDKLRPLQNRAIQGRYSPGSTFKIVVATAALEEGVDHAGASDLLSRRRDLLRAVLQVPPGRRAWLRRPAPCHRAVVQRLLLHGRQHARRRSAAQVVRAARPGRQERHRPAERGREHRAVDGVEAAARARDETCPHPRRSGTRARRSRSPSARGSCR